jgi:ABC-2 type transport system permease protein
MMLVMTLVFSNLFKSDISNFPIYLFIGNIIFTFNSDATNNSLNSITGNSALIKKIYIPKYLFPLSKAITALVNFFFSFIALIVIMLLTKTPFYSTLLMTPLLVLYLFMFSAGLGLILSVLMVFFRDIAHLYSVISLGWMYITPIFYPASLLEGNLSLALKINPLYLYIDYLRQLVLYNTVPSFSQNIVCFLFGVIFLVIGLIVFYKKQDKFILYI